MCSHLRGRVECVHILEVLFTTSASCAIIILDTLRAGFVVTVQESSKHVNWTCNNVQSCPSTTRLVIRRIGCNAVDHASRFFCRQGGIC